jgi:hypothetical protein
MTLDPEALWLIVRNAANCGAYTRLRLAFDLLESVLRREVS